MTGAWEGGACWGGGGGTITTLNGGSTTEEVRPVMGFGMKGGGRLMRPPPI